MMRGLLAAVFVALSVMLCVRAHGRYVLNQENGISYRIVYQSRDWQRAKEVCEEDGAKLAVPKSPEEFSFIQKLVRGMYYPNITGTEFKLLVYLGINNLDDPTVWRNVDGEDITDTGYHSWAGDNGRGISADPAEPHCVGMDASNPGLREWWCHRPQPFVCQKDEKDNKKTQSSQPRYERLKLKFDIHPF